MNSMRTARESASRVGDTSRFAPESLAIAVDFEFSILDDMAQLHAEVSEDVLDIRQPFFGGSGARYKLLFEL